MDLAWSSSAGATEYHVLRSTTSGGPYSQIGTATGLTFPDTAVTAGTTYFYVVRAATGPTCESGNSNEASATPTGPPDFSLSISPASVTVPKGGGTAIYTVTITRINGFADPELQPQPGLRHRLDPHLDRQRVDGARHLHLHGDRHRRRADAHPHHHRSADQVAETALAASTGY